MLQRQEVIMASMDDGEGRLGILWFVWLGAVLGTPYLLGFSEPCGTVAYAGAYGFAALGILLGLIACDVVDILVSLCNRTLVRRAVWTIGLVSTGVLGLLELARLGNLAFVYEALTGDATWPHIWASTYAEGTVAHVVTDTVIACLPFEKCWACVNGFLCALCGYTSGCSAGGGLRKHGADALSSSRFPSFALGLVIGLARMFAWTLLLPHASYPLAVADGFLGYSDVWDALEPMAATVPFLLVVLGSFALGRLSPQASLPVLVGACVGELAMRVVSRVVPEMLAISFPIAVGCLTAQTVAVLLAGRMPHLAGSCRFRRDDAVVMPKDCVKPVPGGFVSGGPAHDLASALTIEEEALLAPYGLSAGEMNAVRAARLELSSSEAAAQLGVRPSTVRAQRVRACAKVGAESIEQLVSDLLFRRGPFAVPAGSGEVGARVTGENGPVAKVERNGGGSVGPACLYVGGFGCLALMFLPYNGVATTWISLQLTSLSCMCGFVLLAVARMIVSNRLSDCARGSDSLMRGGALPLALLVIGLVASLCVLIFFRRGAYGLDMSPGARLVVFVATICLVVCGCLCLRHGRYLLASSDAGCRRAWWFGTALLAAPVVACIGPDAWLAALVGCCLAVSFGCWACRADCPWAFLTCDERNDPPVTWWRFLLLSCLGFAWEESWRGQTYISLQEACVPMLVVVCAVAIWLACREEAPFAGRRAMLLAAVCIPVMAAGLVLGVTAALLLCCAAFAALSPVADNVPVGTAHCWRSAYGCLAPVLGMAVGLYGVNVFGTEYMSWSSSFAPSAWALDSLVGGIVGCGLLVVALGCVGGLALHVRETQAVGAFCISFDPDCLRSYLTGRGFSKAQVDVVELLCQGMSVADVAVQLAYSRVAVDRMRRDAYAHLGVHGRMQLIEVLTRAMTPPNKSRAR